MFKNKNIMITLIFNTTEKFIVLKDTEGYNQEEIKQVPTVKVESGYYEVMQTQTDTGKAIPVLRVPIQNTIMRIVK